jgi:hypothetical protein
MKIGD